jgi:hypothetical protein
LVKKIEIKEKEFKEKKEKIKKEQNIVAGRSNLRPPANNAGMLTTELKR